MHKMYDSLTPRERAKLRYDYIKHQDGKCYWCQGALDNVPPSRIQSLPINWRLFPKGFLTWPIHLQHCHKTGMTEGAVHALCNAVMWQYHGR